MVECSWLSVLEFGIVIGCYIQTPAPDPPYLFLPPAEDLTAFLMHTDVYETGSVEFSDPLLNKIQAAIHLGQRDNLMSVPTDCPQRDERKVRQRGSPACACVVTFVYVHMRVSPSLRGPWGTDKERGCLRHRCLLAVCIHDAQGWLGDTQLSAEEALYNFDVTAMYIKFLNDIVDTQVR
jgi:hypothetical protein